jgi:opacity protein-like surface antigen
MQGAKSSISYSFGTYTTTTESKLALNYINIPVMAKYFVTEELSLQAGSQLGILLSATDTSDLTTNFPGQANSSKSTDVKSSVNSTDFAFNLGAGYNITENIGVDLRYSLGLTELNKVSGGTTIKNNVFSLNLGYKF